MEEKLILNVVMNGAEACVPEKCIVEKIVDMYDTHFNDIVKNRDPKDPFIREYRDLMQTDGEGHHCVLFLNSKSGDGFIVQGNGGKFLSQYIPHAADILMSREITQSEKEIHEFFRRRLDNFIEKNDEEFEIPYDIFSDDVELFNSFEDFLDEMIVQNPAIEATEQTSNGIMVTKKELVTTKLYCPLVVNCTEADDCDYFEVPSFYLNSYVDEINEHIENYIEDEEKERGLIYWTDNPRLGRIIHSVFPSVELREADIFGVLTVESYGEISESDMRDLIDEMTGQLSDGWGEGFEQRELKLGDELYAISFWNCGGGFYLLPESEVFPAGEIKMGGI